MERFAALGVEIQVTEMDVGIDTMSEQDLEKQADVYGDVMSACLRQKMCTNYEVGIRGSSLSA